VKVYNVYVYLYKYNGDQFCRDDDVDVAKILIEVFELEKNMRTTTMAILQRIPTILYLYYTSILLYCIGNFCNCAVYLRNHFIVVFTRTIWY